MLHSSNTYLHWSWLFHSQPRAHLAPLWSLLSMKCIVLGVLEIRHVVNFKAGFLSFSVTPWCVKPMLAWGCGRKFARLHILDFDGEQLWCLPTSVGINWVKLRIYKFFINCHLAEYFSKIVTASLFKVCHIVDKFFNIASMEHTISFNCFKFFLVSTKFWENPETLKIVLH